MRICNPRQIIFPVKLHLFLPVQFNRIFVQIRSCPYFSFFIAESIQYACLKKSGVVIIE
jgi:hypothetical protein